MDSERARREAAEATGADALDRLKQAVAADLELDDDIRERGFANMTTHEVGLIGGHMVRRLVRAGEAHLAEQQAEEES